MLARPMTNSVSTLLSIAVLATLIARPTDACPDAEKLIEHMAEAHGGMEAWAQAPTVSFEDEFLFAGATVGAVSRVVVEQGQRRAYIDYPGTEMSMAWDGTSAWSRNWATPYPPRFMALLNYHFLNLPWLAADPGVILSEFGVAMLPNDPIEYFTVKLSYETGTGDTPRDYYRLFVHPESHRLRAAQYIVTYRAILPEGVTQTPPNTLVYEDFSEVNGLVVPTQYTIYQNGSDDELGSVFLSTQVRDWAFDRPFDEARMTPAAGDIVDESTP